MKILCSIFILFLVHINIFAQENNSPITQIDTMKPSPIPPPVSTPAHYPGGMKEFNKVFIEEFRMPNISDTIKSIKIVLIFTIEKDGSLTNFKMAGKTNPEAGNEAISILKKMIWIPMISGNKVVRTQFTLPITIQVQ